MHLTQSGSGSVVPTLSETAFVIKLQSLNVLAGGPAVTRTLYVDYDPYYGTICIVDTDCDFCTISAECADFDYSTEALLNTFWDFSTPEYYHEAIVSYTCGTAMGFKLSNGTVIDEYKLTCGWNNEWDVSTTLPTCVWTHCLQPPVPENIELLEDWNGQPIEFNYTIPYKCVRGQRFLRDVNIESADAICRAGNIWEKPYWGVCVESERH